VPLVGGRDGNGTGSGFGHSHLLDRPGEKIP
jgi:hypothetical protein